MLTPRGMVCVATDCCLLLPGADQGAAYIITEVNKCRNPAVSEVIDIVPIQGTTVQQSSAQTGERQFLHGGAWPVPAREWGSLDAVGSSLHMR